MTTFSVFVSVSALSKSPCHSPLVGREINPLSEITVSVGATEGMFAIMQAFVNEGE